MLAEHYRETRGSWKCDLCLNDIQIELFSFPDPPPRPNRPEAAGLRHLAFTVDDLDSVVANIEITRDRERADPHR